MPLPRQLMPPRHDDTSRWRRYVYEITPGHATGHHRHAASDFTASSLSYGGGRNVVATVEENEERGVRQ